MGAGGGKNAGRGGGKNAGGQAGHARVNVNITTEQRTRIRETIVSRHVSPVHVTFSVNVGVRIPHTVRLYALPPEILTIVPEYRGYEYFVTEDGVIVIVDPGTWEIVYVITA